MTLLNLSGAAYPDANLKLIAGDVHRVEMRSSRRGGGGGGGGGLFGGEDAGFEAKSFFEYHLYTLPRRTDILANSSQQIRLFPTARSVPMEKVLVLDPLAELAGIGWAEGPHAARAMGSVTLPRFDVQLRFVNDEASGLGGALPRGRIRVYKQDPSDGTLEFIGEDLIDHTPRNERVSVSVGRAFDLVGERTQVEFSVDTDRRIVLETIRLDLRNRKDVAQKVLVRERLFRWSTSEMVAVSPEPQRMRAGVAEWDLELPADGAAVIEYTVRYTW